MSRSRVAVTISLVALVMVLAGPLAARVRGISLAASQGPKDGRPTTRADLSESRSLQSVDPTIGELSSEESSSEESSEESSSEESSYEEFPDCYQLPKNPPYILGLGFFMNESNLLEVYPQWAIAYSTAVLAGTLEYDGTVEVNLDDDLYITATVRYGNGSNELYTALETQNATTLSGVVSSIAGALSYPGILSQTEISIAVMRRDGFDLTSPQYYLIEAGCPSSIRNGSFNSTGTFNSSGSFNATGNVTSTGDMGLLDVLLPLDALCTNASLPYQSVLAWISSIVVNSSSSGYNASAYNFSSAFNASGPSGHNFSSGFNSSGYQPELVAANLTNILSLLALDRPAAYYGVKSTVVDILPGTDGSTDSLYISASFSPMDALSITEALLVSSTATLLVEALPSTPLVDNFCGSHGSGGSNLVWYPNFAVEPDMYITIACNATDVSLPNTGPVVLVPKLCICTPLPGAPPPSLV